jgi:hypothetical protein
MVIILKSWEVEIRYYETNDALEAVSEQCENP